jgi:two-component system phosphate regulon sensor histidine kinase PhoR
VGFRLKLFLASVGVILLATLGADLYLARALAEDLGRRIDEDALVRLRLLEGEVSRIGDPLDDVAAWDLVADDLGVRASARVTIVRLDGTVIGDSEVDLGAISRVANHSDRPEIAMALAAGRGQSTRRSETVKKQMSYVAIPFQHAGVRAGTVRIATPLTEVEAAVARQHKTLLAAAMVACLAAIVLSSVGAHWVSKVVRNLTSTAERMASGDLEVRTRAQGADELAKLGGALDHLAASLSTAIRELRDERDLLGAVLDGMEEGVLVLDDRGRIVRMNPALRHMLLLGSDAVGRELLDVVRHADLKELVDAARHEPQVGEIETLGMKPRRLLVRAGALVRSPVDGERLVVVRDVTDVRRLETIRRDFVANVSHELRTPVTAIRSAGETLQDALVKDPAAALKFLDIIERNADRLNRLIEDLLDLSRIESKELRLSFENVDLLSPVEHTVLLFRDRATKRNVTLRVERPETRVCGVVDRRAFEQVVTNLVDNAVKYCPGATVTLHLVHEDDKIVVRVEDTGPVIEARHLPRLFERFYRVDAGRSRELGGTGLGLSIVKHLVEAMRGTLDVKSVVGQGTTFELRVPAVSAR